MVSKTVVFVPSGNFDWQTFILKREQFCPDAVVSPVLNVKRWCQSVENSDDFNDVYFHNLEKLFEATVARLGEKKFYLRLRVTPKDIQSIPKFLEEVPAKFTENIALDLHGKPKQIHWDDFQMHKQFIHDVLTAFQDKISLVFKPARDASQQQEYDDIFSSKVPKIRDAETDVIPVDYIASESAKSMAADLQLIKRYIIFAAQKQGDNFVNTRKFLLRVYHTVKDSDPFSKLRLRNTLAARNFEELSKGFTLQINYLNRKSDPTETTGPPSKKSKTTELPDVDIFKKRPDLAKIQPTVVVDCSWADKMSEKEMTKLVCQMARLYGVNKRQARRTRVLFTSITPDGFLHTQLLKKYGEQMLKWGNEYFMKKSFNNVVKPEDYSVIYLSPDSDVPLCDADLKRNSVFVIGGLVDESVQSGLSLAKAKEQKLETRRLPIAEHAECAKGVNTTPALAINHVGEILFLKMNQELRESRHIGWSEVFRSVLPDRLGLS